MMKKSSYSISVVSHGQGALVMQLMEDLNSIKELSPSTDEIVVTINIPEDESFLLGESRLPVRIIRNSCQMGFGSNHNQALASSEKDIFLIVNPDIRIKRLSLGFVEEILDRNEVGVVGPVVVNPYGKVEDSARRFPTPATMALRYLTRIRNIDYCQHDYPFAVDWIAGMFLAIKRSTFVSLNGFDESYFMYMEDVDLCRRISRLGLTAILDPRNMVEHHARRDSNRRMKYLIWHLRSALLYFYKGILK
jgi:N-acetylglucosaminyl-diphospho-decaprenol L-rhamnosyltransferase